MSHDDHSPDSKFCRHCAKAIAPRLDMERARAERRQLTVVFCDLVNSTGLAEQLDPEDLRDLVVSYQAACEKAVSRMEGHIAQYLGDGILAYFGYPIAHEDAPVRAVRAGLAIVEAVRALKSDLSNLEVRVGIHTGLVVVGSGRREQLAIGETPNVAARIQGCAAPNTVVISEATHRASRGFFDVKELEVIPLKGISRPLKLYRVSRETGAMTRMDVLETLGATPFVGRDLELGVLGESWERVAHAESGTVAICGEPGMGKSRLVHVFVRPIARKGGRILFCNASSTHQNSALYPMIRVLRTQLGFSSEEPPKDCVARIEEWLQRANLFSSEAVWLVASLLSIEVENAPSGISPQRKRQLTLGLLADWLIGSSNDGATLCVVEDLHWADPSTLDLVQLLISRQERGRFQLCLTYRPEFRAPWPSDGIIHLLLQPLQKEETEHVAAHVAGGKMIPPAVLRALVARSGGVPLYIEEVTKAILETGILAEREDHFELVGPISDRVVPMTTQDSLVARIDRLGPSKATAQIAAVLGREFRFDVLRAISAVDDGTLRRDVDRLVETGLARPIGDEGAGVYVFKHALIQEAAYETLLRRSRQEIHQRIAETLGEEFREVAASQPELVARHYEGAGLLEQAIPHWETAGLRALERAANHEAIAHLGSALGALQGLGNTPERRRKELQLQLRLAPACMAIHGWAAVEVEVACNRAREIAEELGEGEGLFGALWGLWTVHFVRGDLTRALAIAQRVLEMGLAANQPMLQVLGRHAVAYTSFFAGDLKGTRENAEKGLELFDLRQERDIVMFFQLSSSVALHNILALALWCLGCPREAAKEVETAEALAAVLDHRPSTAFCLSFSVYHAFHARHVARVRELADRLYRISVEEGFALWIPVAMLYGAWSRVILSESGDAAAELEKGLVQFHMTGTKATLVQIQALVAETRTLLGRSEEAMAAVVAGLEEVAARGERNFEAELYRIRGEILSSLGGAENVAEAEASIRCAMRIAKESGAKAFEFRALVSLTRLLGRLGRATEIRHAFEAICDGFDTGIDTPDLTEARALRREFEELRKYA